MQNQGDVYNETGFFIQASETADLTSFSNKIKTIKGSLDQLSSVPYTPLLQSERSASGDFYNYILNVSVSQGKWYFEVQIHCDTEIIIGWDALDAIPRSNLVEGVGTSKYSYGYQVDAGFLQHDGLILQQYKILQKGDTFGVSIDMDTNSIIFYQNGNKIVGFTNINENSPGPFFPAVSMEAGSKIEWLIQTKDFSFPIADHKGLGDGLDLSKVSIIHYTNTNSPPPDSMEFQRAFLYRFEQNFGPVISERIPTSRVASFVAHLAQKISPELRGEVLAPQDLEQLRMMLAGQLKEQIMSRVIRIYEMYFAESISKWKENTLDSKRYPLLSSLRSRTPELITLEGDMKFYIIFHAFAEKLSSENPEGSLSNVEPPPLFDYIQDKLEDKLQGFDATKTALYNLLDVSSVKSAPFEYCKIDIPSLHKWRKGLASKDKMKTVLEILQYVDLPIADFVEKPLTLPVSSLANYLDSYLSKILVEFNRLTENYKNTISQDKAVVFYQNLRKGPEERKAVLSDPQNLHVVMFYSGTLTEMTKKFGEFLYEAYNLKNFRLKSSGNTTTATNTATPSSLPPQSSQEPTSTTPDISSVPPVSTSTTTTTISTTTTTTTTSNDNPYDFTKLDPDTDMDVETTPRPKKTKRKPKKSSQEDKPLQEDNLVKYLLFGAVASLLLIGGTLLYRQYYKEDEEKKS